MAGARDSYDTTAGRPGWTAAPKVARGGASNRFHATQAGSGIKKGKQLASLFYLPDRISGGYRLESKARRFAVAAACVRAERGPVRRRWRRLPERRAAWRDRYRPASARRNRARLADRSVPMARPAPQRLAQPEPEPEPEPELLRRLALARLAPVPLRLALELLRPLLRHGPPARQASRLQRRQARQQQGPLQPPARPRWPVPVPVLRLALQRERLRQPAPFRSRQLRSRQLRPRQPRQPALLRPPPERRLPPLRQERPRPVRPALRQFRRRVPVRR